MDDDANSNLFIITGLGLSAGALEEKFTRIMVYACDKLFMHV